jgi:hypothetical protein
MRWIAIPLGALVLFVGAGFASQLSRTTHVSAALAASAREAPRSTSEAARQTAGLPLIAKLTGKQATAFDGLVGAIRETSHRVQHLNAVLRAQSQGIPLLREAVLRLRPDLACAQKRLEILVRASGAAPRMLAEARTIVGSLVALQDRSAIHLRSINRKLAAFGVLADASSTQPLAPPSPLGISVPHGGHEGQPSAPC